jgi:hypothetical protein
MLVNTDPDSRDAVNKDALKRLEFRISPVYFLFLGDGKKDSGFHSLKTKALDSECKNCRSALHSNKGFTFNEILNFQKKQKDLIKLLGEAKNNVEREKATQSLAELKKSDLNSIWPVEFYPQDMRQLLIDTNTMKAQDIDKNIAEGNIDAKLSEQIKNQLWKEITNSFVKKVFDVVKESQIRIAIERGIPPERKSEKQEPTFVLLKEYNFNH